MLRLSVSAVTAVLAAACSSAGQPASDIGQTSSGLAPLARVHQLASGRYVQDVCDHTQLRHCFAERLLPDGWTPDVHQLALPRQLEESGSLGTASGMAPADILAAYDVPANTSADGAIVAILDSPDSNAARDLAAYRANYGLPALPVCTSGHGGVGKTPCFSQVNESGGASSGQDSGDADGETSLDMDMISAVCPDCSILLVELDQLADQDFITAVKTAASLGAVATSISIGGPEEGTIGNPADPTGYTTPGHLVLAASGDFGYDLVIEGAATPSYPASSPDVVAVGGTNLFLTSGSPGTGSYAEAVWNDGSFSGVNDVTTSGCSVEFAAPSWQASLVKGACGSGGNATKATVDLSAAATYTAAGEETAIASYCTANISEGGTAWSPVEGTSAASPLVAGLLTRLGLAVTVSNDIGWLYTNAANFHDLGSASYPSDPDGTKTNAQSGCSPAVLCTVETGWDGPSGLGTPNGSKLVGSSTTPPADAGAPVDAGSDSGTSSNLVVNGDFQDGNLDGWTLRDGYASFVAGKSQNGSAGSAMIGRKEQYFGYSILEQNVAVPSSGTTTLSYWGEYVCTGNTSLDYERVRIMSAAGSPLATISDACDDHPSGFTNKTFDLTPYAGQTVRLQFGTHGDNRSTPDSSYWYLSNVSVTHQ
jgi:subtilase family serine protease